MLTYYLLDPWEQSSTRFDWKTKLAGKYIWKYGLQNFIYITQGTDKSPGSCLCRRNMDYCMVEWSVTPHQSRFLFQELFIIHSPSSRRPDFYIRKYMTVDYKTVQKDSLCDCKVSDCFFPSRTYTLHLNMMQWFSCFRWAQIFSKKLRYVLFQIIIFVPPSELSPPTKSGGDIGMVSVRLAGVSDHYLEKNHSISFKFGVCF